MPLGLGDDKALEARPPDYKSFDVTLVIHAWLSRPASNKGIRLTGADPHTAVLEISFKDKVDHPLPIVRGLKAEHKSGQTFLTWNEPEDVVGEDALDFDTFEKRVLEARARRRIVYRVYRHDAPIRPADLGRAKLVREVPEGVSCWDMSNLSTKNSEHIGKSDKPSALYGLIVYPGQRLQHRYRIKEGGVPLARATGLAVIAPTSKGKGYYAVTVSVDGREATSELQVGENLSEAVVEEPSKFPAFVLQSTQASGKGPEIATYSSWLEPPYVHPPKPANFSVVRWPDTDALPPVLMQQEGRDADMSSPDYFSTRRYVRGSLAVGIAAGHTLYWHGQHECLGTLRGYGQARVWNHEQRRALLFLSWMLEHGEIRADPDRVYVRGGQAAWCLRHPDVFAAVMSEGCNDMRTSREGRKYFWRWAPPGAKNWLGLDPLETLDLAKWVRDHPAVELPLWIGFPSAGFFPDHTLGDYGFRPWQEFIAAMKETKRAFIAEWNHNGPGLTRGFLGEMLPHIQRHQSLPAFGNCSLDSSPDTPNPKGGAQGFRGDKDYLFRADKEGGIGIYQRWDTSSIVDEPDRWEMTVWLAADAPVDRASMDITPRRCQKFRPAPGESCRWTNSAQSGQAIADQSGLVTLRVEIGKEKNRIKICK